MDTTEWMHENVVGFNMINVQTMKLFRDFAVMWSYAEVQCFSSKAGLNTITSFAPEQHEDRHLRIFEGAASHYERRYLIDGETNSKFDELAPLDRGHPDLRRELITLLENTNKNTSQKIHMVLLICYRLRNNSFHGKKWQYSFNDQEQNFSHAILSLQAACEL